MLGVPAFAASLVDGVRRRWASSGSARPVDLYLRQYDHPDPRRPWMVRHIDGAVSAMLAVDGAAYECLDEGRIEDWHERLCKLHLDLNRTPRLTLTTHLVRAPAPPETVPMPAAAHPFVRELQAGVRARQIGRAALSENAHYVGLVVRPPRGRWAQGRQAPSEVLRPHRADVEALEAALDLLEAELARHHGLGRLGVRRDGPTRFSEPAEALSHILTTRRRAVPIPAGRLSRAVLPVRPVFRSDGVAELRAPGRCDFGVLYGFQAEPEFTHPGMFDPLLAARYRHSFSQSFVHTPSFAAQNKAVSFWKRMVAADDPAHDQMQELLASRGELLKRSYGMGEHNLVLLAVAEHARAVDAVADAALTDLRSCGAPVAALDWDHEANFWGAAPGSEACQSRAVPWKTRNMAGAAPLRGFNRGWRNGRWCDHAAVFETTGGTAFHWNPHTDPEGGPGDVGHALFTGSTGVGKTATMCALGALLHDLAGCQVVFFDKDQGAYAPTLRIGGTYVRLRMGECTWLAPLKGLDPNNTGDMDRLRRLTRAMILHGGGYAIPAEYEERIDLALDTVMRRPVHLRGFGEVMAFFGTDPAGPGARLRRWVRGLGDLGWVLDAEEDRVARCFDDSWVAIDQTSYLKHTDAGPFIQAYLFHLVGKRVDGRRLLTIWDEVQESFKYQSCRDLILDSAATFRKLEAILWLATQSVATLLNVADIADVLRDNCLTHFHFANGSAIRAQYERLGVPAEAFGWVKGGSRMGPGGFLLRQGSRFTPLRWPLGHLSDVLATLSSRAVEVELLDRVFAARGPDARHDPAAWAEFHRRRKTPAFRARVREWEREQERLRQQEEDDHDAHDAHRRDAQARGPDATPVLQAAE